MLILFAHGSKNPPWRAPVEELAEWLQAELGQDQVRLAYMAHSPPTLADAVADAIGSGAKNIHVLPLFLSSLGHVDRDLRPLVDRLSEAHPSIQLELLPPVGQHRLFFELVRELAIEAAREED